MNAIELTNVSYTYSPDTPFKKLALDNVSFAVKANTITGLMGHTGCGKSTAVQMFNGLLKPDSGSIKVFGDDIWADPKQIKKYRFKVGLVFQYPEYQLFEETVKADIAYGPKNIGLDESEIDLRVKDAAELCRIDSKLLEKSPFDLSGGQKRRVAIAGIMAMQPDVLVLDEPAAGLDPRTREDIFEGIRDYKNEKNSTVVIVSHSMEDMAKYSDEIIVMSNAKLFMQGEKSEIFKKAASLTEVGLGVPPITHLMNMLKDKGIDVGDGCYSVEDAVHILSKVLS